MYLLAPDYVLCAGLRDSAIFCGTEDQRREAEAWVARRQPATPPLIATEILGPPTHDNDREEASTHDAGPFAPAPGADRRLVFWPAEPLHQSYLRARGQVAAKGCTDNIRCYG